MCDYSLHGLPSRLAARGEELVAHRFRTGAIGLASPAQLLRGIGSRNDRTRNLWVTDQGGRTASGCFGSSSGLCPSGGPVATVGYLYELAERVGGWAARDRHIHADRRLAGHVPRRVTVCERTADSAAGAEGGPARSGIV